MAVEIAKARDVLFLGRGPMYPLALEGALKLKEISYIHAEGYAAGELKHGPIALVDENTPIVILAPFDSYFEKSASNMSEVMARGGQVVFITDPEGQRHAPAGARVVVTAPALRSPDRAPGDGRADPAPGLLRGRPEGRGRRPAAQPGEVGDGGIACRLGCLQLEPQKKRPPREGRPRLSPKPRGS